MIAAQRRRHFWTWVVLAAGLPLGIVAGLAVRPAELPEAEERGTRKAPAEHAGAGRGSAQARSDAGEPRP